MNMPPHIIWLASFPKSGNTWFRILLANLTVSTPTDINALAGGIASNRYEFEMETLLDSSLLLHDEIDDLRPRVYATIAAEASEDCWIKVHDAYTTVQNGEPLFGGNVSRAAIYLVRDPRDVAISMAYHSSTSIDDAINTMNSADSVLSGGQKGLARQLRQKLMGWSGHVLSWLDQTDVPVHVVRYEDLLAAPTEFFAGALKFAGRPATPVDIERAVQNANFSELQRQEIEKGFAERIGTTLFFRSGVAGGWRDKLTAEQIARIEERHAPIMQRLGYELSTTLRSATANDQRAAL